MRMPLCVAGALPLSAHALDAWGKPIRDAGIQPE